MGGLEKTKYDWTGVYRDNHGHYELFTLCKRKQMGKVKKNGHPQILSILNEYQLYPLQMNSKFCHWADLCMLWDGTEKSSH